MIIEEITVTKLIASSNRVLCNGETKSSVGGEVFCPTRDLGNWKEMSEEDADAWIAENAEVEDETERV